MYLPWVVLHKLKSSPKGIGRLLNDHEHRVPRPTGTLGLTVLNPVTPSPSTSQRNVHESITYPGTLLTLPFKGFVETHQEGQVFWALALQSMGSLGVGHDWATSLSLFTFMHGRRKWQPTPVFLPGESQGWGSLVGCCLWGRTESGTTEAT